MAQITVHNPAIVQRLQTDQAFRNQFLANTHATLDHLGYKIDQKTLDAAIQHQLTGQPEIGQRVAGTNVLITIF